MSKDWLFIDDGKIFHFRAAGILLCDGKILLQREMAGKEFALPGGHVNFGETGAQAVVREFMEEVGQKILPERLVWVEENFWRWGDKPAHNITHYYLVRFGDSVKIPTEGSFDPIEPHLAFEWVGIEDLANHIIYPEFLPEEIVRLPEGVKHFVRGL